MIIEKVDHIGIAVRNLEEAAKLYRDVLGLKVSEIQKGSGRNKLVFVEAGQTEMELLEDTTPDGPIAKYIEKRGEGIHHICFKVDNIAEALQQLKDKGVQLIDAQPRPGARNSQVAFLHPRGTYGVLIELCQEAEKPKRK
jgi:methylmalonyl-CoA/ethylmalonyl-CoA epimerase